jgi:hypothetical protein
VAARREAKHMIYRVADQRAAHLIGTLRDIFSGLETWCAGIPNGASGKGRRSGTVDLMMFD